MSGDETLDPTLVNDLDEMQDAEELLETGLLFEVNRRVLHPFGLALALVVRAGRAVRISPRLVRTDDPDGMAFTQEALADGLRKYLAFMKSKGFVRLARRYEVLGWRSQVEPDVDPNADAVDWSPPAAKLALNARNAILAAREVAAAFKEIDLDDGVDDDLNVVALVGGIVRRVNDLEAALHVLDGTTPDEDAPN
jgi:hypothetical protein